MTNNDHSALIEEARGRAQTDSPAHDLIRRLTNALAAGPKRHPAMSVTPTAPDEREAQGEAERRHPVERARSTMGVALVGARQDAFVEGARWAAGFRRSREATTEARPEPEWEYGVVGRFGNMVNNGDYRTLQTHRRRKAGPWVPVEAVEASRSPKPTEHTDGSGA